MFETVFRRVPEKWQKDEFADEQRAQVFDRHLRRIAFLAKVAGGIGALFGACFLAYPLLKRPHLFRVRLLLFPVMCAMIASAMVTGTALLFGPYAFFASERGRKYLWSIGTHNVFVARLLVLVALLLGCGFVWLCIYMGIKMMGTES
jgi:hypothetical protein